MKKVAVITGASSGIGRATAEEFARQGYNVAVLARRKELLDSLTEELAKDYPQIEVLALKCDVTKWAEVSEVFTQIEKRFGHVNVLVNNAGAFEYGSLEKTTPEKLDGLIDVNVRGTAYITKAAISSLKKGASGGWAKIVNVSSISGLWGGANLAVYTATKFAVAGLSSGLRRELAPQNIKVGTIFPGPVNNRAPRGAKKGNKPFMMVPDQIARQIFNLANSNRDNFISHPAFSLLNVLEPFSPKAVDKVLSKMFA